MLKELEELPPAPTASEVQARADGVAQGHMSGLTNGESAGMGEGALMGSTVTLACVAAAQLLWNRARRARAQRQSWSKNVEVGIPAQAL